MAIAITSAATGRLARAEHTTAIPAKHIQPQRLRPERVIL